MKSSSPAPEGRTSILEEAAGTDTESPLPRRWAVTLRVIHANVICTILAALLYGFFVATLTIGNVLYTTLSMYTETPIFGQPVPYAVIFSKALVHIGMVGAMFVIVLLLLGLRRRIYTAQIAKAAQSVMDAYWADTIDPVARILYWERVARMLESEDVNDTVRAAALMADEAGACFGCKHLRTRGEYDAKKRTSPQWSCAARESTVGIQQFATDDGESLCFPSKKRVASCAYPGLIVRRWDVCD